MFAAHGTVNSCIIMRDDEGKSKVCLLCPDGGASYLGSHELAFYCRGLGLSTLRSPSRQLRQFRL